MPFKSKRQLRTCYGTQAQRNSRWNCDRWLKETPSVCCLPERKGGKVKSRCMRKGERVKGPIQTGPRGGRFFVITEKDSRGKVCDIKVYIPKSISWKK